jgi:hypothetical protein
MIRRPVLRRPSLGSILLTTLWLALLAAANATASIMRGVR